MKTTILALLSLLTLTLGCADLPSDSSPVSGPAGNIKLPPPDLKGTVSLEETLVQRRSIREYSTAPLSLEEVSQLLWAAQGITAEWGGRTAPSAGGLYPLEVYLTVGRVDTLPAGIYKYLPVGHALQPVKNTDVQAEVAQASLDQPWVSDGAIVIVIAGVYERTTVKYGERGIRYVWLEAGHAAQNICLQATALNLGAVTIGAFYDDQLQKVVGMTKDETPLYVIPVGKPG